MIARHHWKTGNAAAVVVALCVSALLFGYAQYTNYQAHKIEEARREAALPDRWFVVRNVAVPDFIEGADPLITYSREVRQQFIGEWIVEVHAVGNDAVAPCYGSGRSRYDPNEFIPETGVRLSWFIGGTCQLPPGKYILDTTWSIMPEGYPKKEIRFLSNPFTVLPKGSQLYVTPQQAQILDNCNGCDASPSAAVPQPR